MSAGMNASFAQLLVRWVILALGVTLATKLVNGITCDDTGTLVCVVLLLSFFNAIVKPLMVLVSLPFIILTLGFGMLVINALLFLFVGRLVEGFHVAGFWPAVWGSLVVSLTNMFLGGFARRPALPAAVPPAANKKPDDVIDI
jgi:putative membrane protein